MKVFLVENEKGGGVQKFSKHVCASHDMLGRGGFKRGADKVTRGTKR